MFDILIRNGQVVDGLGSPRRQADLGIAGDRIVALGDLADRPAARTIDATGRIVAPGFVDVHSHSDYPLLVNRKAESSIRMGVTTEVIGNCGSSWATVRDLSFFQQVIPGFVRDNIPIDWSTYAQYLEKLEQPGIAINVVPQIGHGAVRIAVMGFDARLPTSEELGQMKALVAEALDAGAVGLSFGLQYIPACNANYDEVVALCQVAAGRGKIVTVHLRDYTNHYLEGIQEMLNAVREVGTRLQIAHVHPHKGGPPPAENWERAVALMEQAHRDGIDLGFDHHPYLWAQTGLRVILPAWAAEGGVAKVLERLQDPATRERIKQSRKEGPFVDLFQQRAYDKFMLVSVRNSPHLVGKTLAEIGEIMGKDPYDAALDILLAEGEYMAGASWIGQLYDENVLTQILTHSLNSVESDGSARSIDGPLAGVGVHPRSFGWTAKMIGHHVRERQVISLEDAIHHMTAIPAARVGLSDRGRLAEGAHADVVVFDFAAIEDNATYLKPAAYPSGIHQVLVNGTVVVDEGNHTGALPGAVIRTA